MKKLTGSRMIFLYIAIVIISLLSIISAFWLYNSIESLLIEEKGEQAMSVSIAVAELVEQDYSSFQTLLETSDLIDGNFDKVYYEKMQHSFQEIKEKTGVKFIYCGKRITAAEMVYLFDGEDPASTSFSPIGSKDTLDEMEAKVYASNRSYYTSIINNSVWGKLLTGAAPIIDPETGETTAHVGVDVSAEQIQKSLIRIKNMIFLNSIIIIIITSLIIYKLLCMNSLFIDKDYLTGLYSKGYEERFLEQLIKKSTISGKSFPLIMIDFDDFKLINDVYGHHFGDTVLKSVADIIKLCTRSVDCCARYGGDEFVIVLPEANLEYATLVCQWLLNEVSNLKLQAKHDSCIAPVSISIGIALWEKEMTSAQILINADKALYQSKRTGKGKMVIYSDDLA